MYVYVCVPIFRIESDIHYILLNFELPISSRDTIQFISRKLKYVHDIEVCNGRKESPFFRGRCQNDRSAIKILLIQNLVEGHW